jgi:hypothetical protein
MSNHTISHSMKEKHHKTLVSEERLTFKVGTDTPSSVECFGSPSVRSR